MEIKIRYVISNGKDILSAVFTLDEIQENGIDFVYEQFEKQYGGECNCLNESCSVCECEPVFDEYKIISRDLFIGIQDKNGKDIYEGDICKWHTTEDKFEPKWPISYDRNVAAFKMNVLTLYQIFQSGYYQPPRDWISGLEIIGNIYKNHELLEDK